jgi:hypothetical protein
VRGEGESFKESSKKIELQVKFIKFLSPKLKDLLRQQPNP